jgi:hypothetical protein
MLTQDQVYTAVEASQRSENLLSEEQVKDCILKKGTKFATVSFIKKDGTIRVVNGLFKPTSKIVGSDKGMAQGEAMKARGQIPIYEVSSGSWKSFYADRVVEIV